MTLPRPFALLTTSDQWRRAAFQDTALEQNVVQLSWLDAPSKASSGGIAPTGAGLAFDCECRLYHSIPEGNQIQRVLWAEEDPLRPSANPPQTYNLFDSPRPSRFGEFSSSASAPAVSDPRGLCVDSEDRLFVAEHGTQSILVFDLDSDRLLRTIALTGSPVALAADDLTVYAAMENPSGLVRLDAHRGPWSVQVPPIFSSPARLTFDAAGNLWILASAASSTAVIFPLQHPEQSFSAPYATDIAFLTDDSGTSLVVARMPGDDFLRYSISDSARDELPPLTATNYDGRGIVVTPDNRLAYWTTKGLRYARRRAIKVPG